MLPIEIPNDIINVILSYFQFQLIKDYTPGPERKRQLNNQLSTNQQCDASFLQG
jgi:hypothetical protein